MPRCEEMTLKHNVVELFEQDEPEYMDIIIQAFHDLPQIPILIKKPEKTESIIKNLVKLYKKTGTIKVFGIRENDQVICVGFCIDSDSKPGFFKVLRFGFSLLLTVGLEGIREFWIYNENKPKYEKRCLELFFYGTRATHQRRGYGASMLQFLYEYAQRNGFGGVTGVTNTSRPAFHFYMREGWIVDTEFRIGKYTLCWVRYIV